MKNKGFTLIELVVIIVILSIITIASMTTLDTTKTIKLDAASKKVFADIEYTRAMALVTAKWYGVIFNVDPANTYSVYETDGITDTIIPDPSAPGATLMVNVSNKFQGVTISSAGIGGGNKVEFSPLSVPYNDKNGLKTATDGTIVLSYSGSTKTIAVKPNTGMVIIQ